jgi:hypothetical protein
MARHAPAQPVAPPGPARLIMDYWQMGASYNWFKDREGYFHHLYYNRTDGKETRCGLNLTTSTITPPSSSPRPSARAGR